jgi:hypothetical protein
MDKSSAVQEAIKAVMALVQDADAREMIGRRPKKVEIEVEAGGEGSPEHEAEEMELIRALEGMHGEEEEDMPPGRGRY